VVGAKDERTPPPEVVVLDDEDDWSVMEATACRRRGHNAYAAVIDFIDFIDFYLVIIENG